ncbi:hypothetical protein CLUG_00814 [Clavispora lusitaniae ATCC 42720]|uniref:tRNA (guanine(37)-N1)-methyltransferase n=1 Tax=Clavispora lusitaniae (strain ATCC 42720) TaxID=306902 RepID=C4XXZ1_CLAL4|nr:uncharacterized protein CLUG_00814 [Clavispora lusitaniae ATCC 42720]EEQ36691.1 hypothetical protein CLUG_00814 [Clavispora lusitaniae ATCC 42720]
MLKRFRSFPIFNRELFFSPARYLHLWNKTERRLIMQDKFGPPVNRDMRVLDRSFFKKDVNLLVATFPDPKYLGNFVKACKGEILLLPGVKHIVPVENTRGVLLRQDIDDISTYEDKLSPTALEKIKEYGVSIKPYVLTLDYSFWKADDILNAVLPENLLDEIPTGFAQAGHIAHLNLRSEFKPYGPLIGQVILDKNSKIETVVDKVDSIGTKFRTFKMKILAGKDDFIVEQSESGCKFRFDFSSVYWNSRLSTEHERLITQFQPNEVVGDVFAGVGPFAVPAGKKNVLVLANDLNPESYKYLKENISLNNVQQFVQPYNYDGREFIRESPRILLEWAKSEGKVQKTKTIKRRKVDPQTKEKITTKDVEVTSVPIPKFFTNYVMNLPDSALTFLDEFVGLYSRFPEVEEAVKNDPDFKLPIINVHCFEKYSPTETEPSMEELHRRVHAKIVKLIGFEAPFEKFSFHLVRKVSPTKPMFCVTFELPHEVAFKK